MKLLLDAFGLVVRVLGLLTGARFFLVSDLTLWHWLGVAAFGAAWSALVAGDLARMLCREDEHEREEEREDTPRNWERAREEPPLFRAAQEMPSPDSELSVCELYAIDNATLKDARLFQN